MTHILKIETAEKKKTRKGTEYAAQKPTGEKGENE